MITLDLPRLPNFYLQIQFKNVVEMLGKEWKLSRVRHVFVRFLSTQSLISVSSCFGLECKWPVRGFCLKLFSSTKPNDYSPRFDLGAWFVKHFNNATMIYLDFSWEEFKFNMTINAKKRTIKRKKWKQHVVFFCSRVKVRVCMSLCWITILLISHIQ